LNHAVLILSHPSWLGGVIGIVANRLVEEFDRPTILFTEDDGIARGSARSIEGVDITAAIVENDEHLIKYGGHKAAAGMSLPADKIPEFRRALSLSVKRMREESDVAGAVPTLVIDGLVDLQDLTLGFIDDLGRLAPFGAGNPSLILATERVTVKTKRGIGRTGKHLRLTVEDDKGALQDVLWWNANEDDIPVGRFDMAYTVSTSTFRGERQLQVVWSDARPVDEPITDFAHRTNVEIIDYRAMSNQATLMDVMADYPSAMLWHEGVDANDGAGRLRHELTPSAVLVIWTLPPDADSVQYALKAVNPETVILFGVDPTADSIQGFLKRFGGIIKHALNAHAGIVTWTQLAGLTAHSVATMRIALNWMITRGHVTIVAEDGDSLTLADGGTANDDDKAKTTAQLAIAIQEASSYRAYFKRADKATLIQTK